MTIGDNGQRHTIQLNDPITDPQLQALMSFVQQHTS
ncbi:hypothetical protein [Dictyobacter vulcani]